jgi:hypothetical protein
MPNSRNADNFILRSATSAEIPALVEHYNSVIAANNARPGRYIDWTPFTPERLEPLVSAQRVLVFEPKLRNHAPAISASIIVDAAPDPQLWTPSDLPARAVGFAKFGVAPQLLGTDFGRTVAMPMFIEWAKQQQAEALYCDALPHLDKYYASLGFTKIGIGGFYSNYYKKHVTVHKHVRKLEFAL